MTCAYDVVPNARGKESRLSVEHAELDVEQRYVDHAYEMLDRGLADAERSMAEFRPQHRSTAQAIRRAMRILQESRGTGQLIFGETGSPAGPVLWLNHDLVARQLLANEEASKKPT